MRMREEVPPLEHFALGFGRVRGYKERLCKAVLKLRGRETAGERSVEEQESWGPRARRSHFSRRQRLAPGGAEHLYELRIT